MTKKSNWNEWWINPVKDGSSEPDSGDLQQTKDYIARTYTPETQAEIRIKVRKTREQ